MAPLQAVTSHTARAHLAFALRLYRALGANHQETVCWSPYSVASALGMAAQGAAGQTAAELRALLTGSPGDVLDGHAALLSEAAQLKGSTTEEQPTFAVVNTLYTRENIEVRDDFLEQTYLWPKALVRDAPFARDPEIARTMINEVVGVITKGLIPELLTRGVVDTGTVAVLVNALYLKTAWHKRFLEQATEDRTFHGVDGDRLAPTMQTTQRLEYAAVNGWQVVILPAEGGVDAVVLLPDGDLADAEAGLDGQILYRLLRAPEQVRVTLFLPKFRLRVASPLNTALSALGVRAMFTSKADFSLLSPDPLMVSRVQHEAVLRIDEHGVEGGAATAVAFALAAMAREPDPVTVRVDRPFLFLVCHRESGALYFWARVSDPVPTSPR